VRPWHRASRWDQCPRPPSPPPELIRWLSEDRTPTQSKRRARKVPPLLLPVAALCKRHAPAD
jgi:hypothetical protein